MCDARRNSRKIVYYSLTSDGLCRIFEAADWKSAPGGLVYLEKVDGDRRMVLDFKF
jgi:hypothetical protein